MERDGLRPDLAGAIAALDGENPIAIAGAVRALTQRLRGGEVGADVFLAVETKLVALAPHRDALVRQTVAEASPYLRDDAFHALSTELAADRVPYVKKAAEDAVARRAAIRRAQANTEEHDGRVARLYAELEAPEAAIAQRIAGLETEYFVRRKIGRAHV